MTRATVWHWRKIKGIKPPCGKVSMCVTENTGRVTCPVCLEAIKALWNDPDKETSR